MSKWSVYSSVLSIEVKFPSLRAASESLHELFMTFLAAVLSKTHYKHMGQRCGASQGNNSDKGRGESKLKAGVPKSSGHLPGPNGPFGFPFTL